MKKFTTFTFLLLFLTFILNSCQKDEVENTTFSDNILVFKSMEEFESTIEEISKMSDNDRANWQKDKNFKSFGTISNSFFESINFDSIKDIEELKALDADNKYLNIYKEEGEWVFEPKELNSIERFVVNEDMLYIIDSTAYKLIDGGLVSSSIKSIEKLKNLKSIDEASFSSIFSINRVGKSSLKSVLLEEHTFSNTSWDKEYKIKVWIQTENFWAFFPTRTQREVEFTVTNYKKGILGWYTKKLPTTYNVFLDTYDEFAPEIGLYINESVYNHDIDSYNKYKRTDVDPNGWSNKYNPVFSDFRVSASNGYTATGN